LFAFSNKVLQPFCHGNPLKDVVSVKELVNLLHDQMFFSLSHAIHYSFTTSWSNQTHIPNSIFFSSNFFFDAPGCGSSNSRIGISQAHLVNILEAVFSCLPCLCCWQIGRRREEIEVGCGSPLFPCRHISTQLILQKKKLWYFFQAAKKGLLLLLYI